MYERRERKGKGSLSPFPAWLWAQKEHQCLCEAPGKSWGIVATSKATRPWPVTDVRAFLHM